MEEKCVNLVKEIGKYHEVKSGRLLGRNDSSDDILIELSWSAKNYSTYEKNTLISHLVFDPTTKKAIKVPSAVQDKRIVMSAHSPCGKKKAQLFQDDDTCFINISSEGLSFSVNLKERDLHGKVYSDPELSSFVWCSRSKLVAFVAEKKKPKMTSFLEKSLEPAEGRGLKFAYQDDWGEQMTGQQESMIVIVDSATEEIKVLGLPEGVCGGQVTWSPGGSLVGVAYVTDPFRLGLIYCMNRDSFMFECDLDGRFSEISEKGYHYQQPRFSPDGKELVYIRSPAGGPHVQPAELMLMDWASKKSEVVLGDVDGSIQLENEFKGVTKFYGLTGRASLPSRCWDSDNRKVVLTTPNDGYSMLLIVDVKSKAIYFASTDVSHDVFDVFENRILYSTSNFREVGTICLIDFADVNSETAVEFKFGPSESVINFFPLRLNYYTASRGPDDGQSSLLPYHCVYPQNPEKPGKVPLIVWVHGGPHSMIANSFVPAVTFFLRLGYAIIFPNYKGSIGYGSDYLYSLPGRIGELDVEHVHQTTLQFLKAEGDKIDRSRVALIGGSHGGFLVTHLSARFPDVYKVVSARNPVVEVSSKTINNDIPDWNFVETGLEYKIGDAPSPDDIKKMALKSPLSSIKNVVAPTLLLLGSKDRRVPMSQGIFYHKCLLARKIPTKVFVYDDAHPLSKVEVEADWLVQTALWFDKYL